MKRSLWRASMALAAVLFTGTLLNAQTLIVETTSRIELPEGKTEKDMKTVVDEMFNNIHAKSEILLGYSIRRHAWGSEGGSVVISWEVAEWADIERFTGEEMEKLATAAWPDEATREAKWKEYNSYLGKHHRDEIYYSMNDVRGYAKPMPKEAEKE